MKNADAWSIPSVVDFFKTHRNRTSEVYPSEWIFLKDLLKEDMSVLDIGCALGGFSRVLSEHLKSFTYTGVDISSAMIEQASKLNPEHRFILVQEDKLDSLHNEQFDLVLCLGILHLNEKWRPLISEAWNHTRHNLLFDLRESGQSTIEDKNISYFKMNFNQANGKDAELTLPYNIINSGDALRAIQELCPDYSGVTQFGYFRPIQSTATSPIRNVVMKTYCISR